MGPVFETQCSGVATFKNNPVFGPPCTNRKTRETFTTDSDFAFLANLR